MLVSTAEGGMGESWEGLRLVWLTFVRTSRPPVLCMYSPAQTASLFDSPVTPDPCADALLSCPPLVYGFAG